MTGKFVFNDAVNDQAPEYPEYAEDLGEEVLDRCASCGKPHAWHGRDEAQRVCDECRMSE